MFKNNYQGGAVVEVFSAQGKDPVAKWKLCGSQANIHKDFNKEIKGFVYSLEGSSQRVKMQLPENGKMSLGLLQRFLVLQVNIPPGKDFSIELVITDMGHLKRRLYLSTVYREFSATVLHAKIPLIGLHRNIWSTWCIDLVSFTRDLFNDAEFLTLDGISLFATCKVRRVFTMKTEFRGMLDDGCDQSALPRPVHQRAIPETAMGSRTPGPPPQTGRKSVGALDGRERNPQCIYEKQRLSPTLSIRPGLCPDLEVRSCWENNEEPELQLPLQEEVFTFSSQPHSPRGGQAQGDQDKMELGEDQLQSKRGKRYEAQPKDDFIGSESDEDESTTLLCQRTTSKYPDSTLDIDPEYPYSDQLSLSHLSPASTSAHTQSPTSGRSGNAGMVPERCLSPCGSRQDLRCGADLVDQVLSGIHSVSLSKRQQLERDDSELHKEEDKTLQPVESSDYDSIPDNNLPSHGVHDEELQMLASLKRQQEEDESRDSSLNASQLHNCDVSISMSSDDNSTWTHVSMPAYQGQHYQKEMNPLRDSNPRDWMDVLSPPIIPTSQQRMPDNTEKHSEAPIKGGDEPLPEKENEAEYLNLLYDHCLHCYFDPKTGKYYELNQDFFSLTTSSLNTEYLKSGTAQLSGNPPASPHLKVGIRLHPGIIAAVIFVSVAAIAAAVLIIRKHCFPVNEATYRYSLLRRRLDQGSVVTEEDGDSTACTVGEESDEDLLE
ncbi:protein CFAP20DC [Aulostomus maculatus]